MSSMPEYVKSKICEATECLKQYMKEKYDAEDAKQLWSDSRKIYVTITFKDKFQFRCKPVLIPLPYPLSNKSVCFIVSKNKKDLVSKLKSDALSKPISVLSNSKLKKFYNTFESKRNLCSQHDVFLCENKLFRHMRKFLGKKFEVYKKIPIPLNLSSEGLVKKFDRIMKSAYFYCRDGHCSTLCIGTGEMETNFITMNVLTILDFIEVTVHEGSNSIDFVALKSLDSPALPVYKAGVSFISEDNLQI